MSLVKCNKCNIVIDELLAYVQNKLSIIDEDSLMRICVSAFKSEEIKRSKQLLFESLPTEKRMITRKNAGKENRDLADIISLLKGTNSELVPIFVARSLEKLPPLTFDHLDVTKLLKDLVLMQTEIRDIKEKYATKDQLKDEILRLTPIAPTPDPLSVPSRFRSFINVNTKRGGYVDSGPTGLSQLDTTTNYNTSYNKISASSPKQNSEESVMEYPLSSNDRGDVTFTAERYRSSDGAGSADAYNKCKYNK
ncbi:uncharacterized protein LOC134753809 [Cydia strobilella]|uniref:uncharacterized protein LOC134753809 n=1 Tax=Cydia strobilella TaxID=1100964 RepID=UPI003006FF1B